VVFVAELPDKTALSAVVLASHHRPTAVLLGAATALTIQSVVAVAAGHALSLLPARPVHLVAGALFLVSALVMWRRDDEAAESSAGAESRGFWRSAALVFGVIFVAEWGDLTQLATAALAARYAAPFTVFAGATVALWAVAAIAAFVGHRASRLLTPDRTRRGAALLFAFLGVCLVTGLL